MSNGNASTVTKSIVVPVAVSILQPNKLVMIPIRSTLKNSVSRSFILEQYVLSYHNTATSQRLPAVFAFDSGLFRNDGRTHNFSSSSSSTREAFAVTGRKINSALRILSLSQGFQPKDLRDAYFDAAKKCHPDSSHSSTVQIFGVGTGGDEGGRSNFEDDDDDGKKAKLSNMFLEITEAYELLRKYPGGYVNAGSKSSIGLDGQDVEYDFISKTEEQHYREAVRESLGIDAEALEESKRCPMFREWLKGKSHMAFHFNLFLMRHGGLAPMLGRKNVVKLSEGLSKRRRKKR